MAVALDAVSHKAPRDNGPYSKAPKARFKWTSLLFLSCCISMCEIQKAFAVNICALYNSIFPPNNNLK